MYILGSFDETLNCYAIIYTLYKAYKRYMKLKTGIKLKTKQKKTIHHFVCFEIKSGCTVCARIQEH